MKIVPAFVLACVLGMSACSPTGADRIPFVDDEQSTAASPEDSGVSILVDTLPAVLNPHLVGYSSTALHIVSQLTLPRPFTITPAGTYQLNTGLMKSAKVISTSPYVVEYSIRKDAVWSDGVPIGAEDFEFLWSTVRSSAGAKNSHAYQRITDITSRDGGKIVRVSFSEPDPYWTQLFSDLLPAHIWRLSDRSLHEIMRASMGVSAGPYMVDSIDRGRGVMKFVRNNRYWLQPAAESSLTVRVADSAQGLANHLRAGHVDVAFVPEKNGLQAAMELQPSYHHIGEVAAETLHLVFNTRGTSELDEDIRRVLINNIPRSTLAGALGIALAQDSSGVDIERVRTQLLELSHVTIEDGILHDHGHPVSITIGVATEQKDTVDSSYFLADWLNTIGIQARAYPVSGRDLVEYALPLGLVDAAIVQRSSLSDHSLHEIQSEISCADGGVNTSTKGSSDQVPTRARRISAREFTKRQLPPPIPFPGRRIVSPLWAMESSALIRQARSSGVVRAPGANLSGICVPNTERAIYDIWSETSPEAGKDDQQALMAVQETIRPIIAGYATTVAEKKYHVYAAAAVKSYLAASPQPGGPDYIRHIMAQLPAWSLSGP